MFVEWLSRGEIPNFFKKEYDKDVPFTHLHFLHIFLAPSLSPTLVAAYSFSQQLQHRLEAVVRHSV